MAVARQDITDVTKWPEAVTTLRDEHRYMSLLLDALEEKIQGEDEIPAPDYFLIHDVVRYMHEYPDAVHHPTEDLMFDKLVARDPATKSAVRDLQRDHEKLTGNTDRILKLLRAAEVEQSAKASNAVREACNLYIDRLRAHMQTEESELFPRAIDRLAPWDWKIIERRLDDVDDSEYFSNTFPARPETYRGESLC
jgi:hemerythrin-like domain-containing protein